MEMKLCAIFHCWGDWYLLEHAVKHMRPLVDGVIIIGSSKSNYGEYFEIPEDFKTHEMFIREPQFSHPMNSETEKRNYGLKIASEQGYTHFINCDSDEFYHPEEFLREKQRFIDNPNLQGLVCATQVYFKSPTLTIGMDTTLVPFIHKLTPTLKHEFNRRYPYAWSGRDIKIDPTRSLNINEGVEWSEIVMHHMSWVRKDYQKKIRNSTARANIEKSTIMQDLLVAKDGVMCNFYGKVLYTVPNYFNLPEYDVLV
jgi:hypothetical protein